MENIGENIEVAVLNLESICRICLEEPEDAINLSTIVYSTVSQEATSYDVQLADITQLEISHDDVLPKQLCKGCALKLQDFHSFRTKTIRNEQYLRQLINQTQQETPFNSSNTVKAEISDEEDSSDIAYLNEEYLIGNEIVSDIKVENQAEITDPNIPLTLTPGKKRTTKNSQAQYECPECKKPFVNHQQQQQQQQQQQRRANGNPQIQQNPDQIRQLIHSMSLGHLQQQQVNSNSSNPLQGVPSQPKISPIEADPIKSLIMQLSILQTQLF